jgi:acylpyruvate hydrolase
MANIWCVGRNYLKHALEMKSDVPSEPLIFLKSFNCISRSCVIQLPSWSSEVHHEIEVAVRLGPGLRPDAFALALDLTARDYQAKAKEKGQPWTLAKSFRGSCPLSEWQNLSAPEDLNSLTFSLNVNGQMRQEGKTLDMIFSVDRLTQYVSQRFPVVPGDILLTGTPEGVGPIRKGDQLTAFLNGTLCASWSVS